VYHSQALEVQGSSMQTLVFEPDAAGPHPGLVVAQHLPVAHAGLETDPFTLDVGERYAAAGYVCVIPFLFHWWPKEAEMLTKAQAFRDDWALADLGAAFDLLVGLDGVDPERVGVLGHCWGGRLAWLAASSNASYKACVVFYGGRLKLSLADGSTPPIELADRISCPLLGIFGNDDDNPSPEDVDDYETALRDAGVRYEFQRLDGAGHGFQDFHDPKRFRQQQSEDAWQKAVGFLDRNLKS
jgi:carboxymethylenebutenolidase